MRWRWEGAGEALRSPIPWIALSAALALTAAAWAGLEHSRFDEARAQFERRTAGAQSALATQMLSYEQVLRSGAARIASSPAISRREWREFIDHLQVEERFPGIRSISYSERVKPEDSFPVVLSEPFTARNARVLGVDMYADPVRRAAMERARDSADVAITGKVVLPAEAPPQAQQPGFLMFVPVFRREARTLAPAGRDAALMGYVSSAFRMHDLVRGVLDERALQVLDMLVFDEGEANPQAELIDTRSAWRTTPSAAQPLFSRRVQVQMPGRLWTVQFLSRPEFDESLRAARPFALLAAAIAASLALFALTVSLVSAWNRAHELSMRDPLTGLYNRRYLDETMGRELPRARRMGQSVGLIVLDIDHFKKLNDTFGHDAGDLVLARTGELLRAASRNSDIACRFGGEEFAIVLPGASLGIARARAEAIRASLESLRVDYQGQSIGPLTVSAGVAEMPPQAQDWAFVLQQADRALYTAKQAGRNKVIAAVDD